MAVEWREWPPLERRADRRSAAAWVWETAEPEPAPADPGAEGEEPLPA
jgi:hypothetical protein